MKKWIILIVIGIIVFGLVNWVIGVNNTMVDMKGQAEKSWANVESSYQRRNDLIGNLVKTVQGAADFEKNTLTEVINARAKATSTTIDAGNLTAQNMAAFQQAQAGLTSALSKLMVVVERYPDLKANQNFLKLQDELASTENQILTARTRFNESVQKYNNYILVFPNSMFLGNYKEKPYFDAVAGAEKPVDVEFDFNKEKK